MNYKFFPLPAVAAVLIASPVMAAWPGDKPIEVVVGFAPGGGTDIMARTLLPFVEKHLGANARFVVINRPGAAGEIANGHVVRARPDGYTLAVVNMPGFYFLPMIQKTQYQPEDFQLIARVVDDPTVMTVRDDSPITSMEALIGQLKKDPGSVSVGHNGTGTNGELAIRLLSEAADVELNAIGYRGTSAQKTDLLGGHLDVAIVSAGELPELHDGATAQVRGLAQFTAERSEALPQVPAAAEAGVPVLMSSERGFAAPKGVPSEIIERLDRAIAAALEDPEFLASTTDGKVLSYLSGPDWQQAVDEVREVLRPLAENQTKN
ncbi:tripartite tricarboxylate transporter substrate binding protein [Rhodocyclaceae bacterium SMB388]